MADLAAHTGKLREKSSEVYQSCVFNVSDLFR